MIPNVSKDGKVSGLFQMEDQEGFPLACSLAQCVALSWEVDWAEYLASAKAAGWPWSRVEKKVREALSDTPEYRASFEQICRQVFNGAVPAAA